MSFKVVDAQQGPEDVPGAPGTAVSAVSQANIHILLVDDDTLARHIVRKALEKCHYKVTAVTSAKEAIRVLESTDNDTFQLILTDVVMPVGGDGLDLLEHVQGNAVWRFIPVVMMSANECIDTVRECLQRGASHYILKPVTQKEIKNLWQYAYRSATRPAPSHEPVQPAAPISPRHTGSTQPLPTDIIAAKAADALILLDSFPSAPTGAGLAPVGINMPLNSAIESQSLPWRVRLTIFCQLLHNTRMAFDPLGPSATVPLPTRPYPFTNPSNILISSSGATALCHTPPHHFSSYHYRAPAQRGGGTMHFTRRYDAAQATYALGILLLELAMAPSPSKVRADYFAALPRVPASLLSSKPEIAVLILRMTAVNAADRPSLAHVARERALYAVYSAVAAAASDVANQEAAGSVAVRRAFLHKVQQSRQQHIGSVTADLECIEADLSRVHAALWHVQQPLDVSKRKAPVRRGTDDVVNRDRNGVSEHGPAAADEAAAPAAAPPAHISWPSRRRIAPAAPREPNPQAEQAQPAQDAVGTPQEHARSGGPQVWGEPWSDLSAKPRASGAEAHEGEQPVKRQRVEKGLSVGADIAKRSSSGSSGTQDVKDHCLRQAVVDTGVAGDISLSSPGEGEAGPEKQSMREVVEYCGAGSRRKRVAEVPAAGASMGDPTDARSSLPSRQQPPRKRRKAPPIPDAVRDRWEHVEPLSMQLFNAYRSASRAGRAAHEGTAEVTGDAAAGAADPQLQSAPWLQAVASDLQAVSRFRWMPVVSSVQHAPSNAAESNSNSGRRMVCAVALDRCEENLAIIGVNKTIRLFRFSHMTDKHLRPSEPRYPVNEILSRSKLTSGCFNAYLQQRLVVADAEGGVTLMDTVSNSELMQFEEHVNRVWSVDCSPHDPALVLSASMDKTVRLWSTTKEASVSMIVESHQVCSAVFHPQNANLLALGTANAAVRLYDVRRLDTPLGTAAAPRAVSYVRFMGDHIVAASVDSVICMYNTAAVARGGEVSGGTPIGPVREFRGHLNQRHFVGLACSPEGYIFTGSENNTVCMYHRSVPKALAEQPVLAQDAMGIGLLHGSERPIVNCLTMDKGLNYVISGGTTGWVNVMKLTA